MSGAEVRSTFLHQNHLVAAANLEQLVANWSRDMRGLHPPTLFLLLLLTVNGQQQEDAAADVEGVEADSNSSESAYPSVIGDQLGTSEEEACSDCEVTSEIIEEEVEVEASNNATELKVLESATYSMASIGATSIFVRLDRVEGQENLQMVCQ